MIKNEIFTLTNTEITKSLQGIYIVSYWQGGGWADKGFGILFSSAYSASSEFISLFDKKNTLTITLNNNQTVTFKSNVEPLIKVSLIKLFNVS